MIFLKYKTLAMALFAMGLFACQDLLEDAYENPNAVTEIDESALFAKSLRELFISSSDLSVYRFSGQYAHYFVAGSDPRKPDLYGDGFDVYYNEISSKLYLLIIKDIEEVLQITAKGERKNELRYTLADIVSVLGFVKLTDAFGDIPYTEGGKGKADEIITPKYDSQEYIYNDMIDRLTASITTIGSANPDLGFKNADFLFHNDMDKWMRFANSIRLRLAMRMRNAAPDNAAAIAQQCLQLPLMDKVEHDAWMIETEDAGNPWYLLKTVFPQIKVSDKFVSMLASTNDPRLEVFAAKDGYGAYSGQLNGLNDFAFGESDFQNKSDMGHMISSKDSKMYLMTASETMLLKAEALLVFNRDVVKANAAYRKAIELSMEQWQVDGDLSQAYLASGMGNLSGSDYQMEEQIGNQMWICITPNFFESWSHIRRTGFPVIEQRTAPELAPGVTNGFLPSRFKYSSFELSANGENVKEAVDRQGPNKIDTPLWWSK
ncbi:Starch-binding associating with outer membrane [Saccharicrinis carchari]|uniref:Starch-binding associating with outer membrane n=1 Tax=Saccharicrinis carchari TaxID=1168039 RepID=A0A521D1Z8_SACCC|nr:SusD/RagB family nutrient-binding outer membrane lipoprotein [Saccharicrinis carchari]SMO65672.1 Starch-binding associating with outer membrane [Saccharicrinis carchari]